MRFGFFGFKCILPKVDSSKNNPCLGNHAQEVGTYSRVDFSHVKRLKPKWMNVYLVDFNTKLFCIISSYWLGTLLVIYFP